VATPPHVPVSAPHVPSAPMVAAPLDRLAAKKAVLAAKRESNKGVHASAKPEEADTALRHKAEGVHATRQADTALRHKAAPQPPLNLLAG
jgi:hypothetical protein